MRIFHIYINNIIKLTNLHKNKTSICSLSLIIYVYFEVGTILSLTRRHQIAKEKKKGRKGPKAKNQKFTFKKPLSEEPKLSLKVVSFNGERIS